MITIGDTSSAASLIIQSYIHLYDIPQVSHATSSSWLNDKLRYPTFLRIVPSDELQAKFVIQLASQLKIERLGLISSSSAWGKSGAASIGGYANRAGICLWYVYQVDQIEKSVIALVEDLMDKINADMRDGGCCLPKPMVIFAEQGILQTIFKQLSYRRNFLKRRGHLFIGVKNWANLYEVISGAENVTLGSITFGLAEGMFNWTFNGENDFENYVFRQTPNSNDFNPFFAKFWQDYFDCHLPKHYNYHCQECRAGMSIGRLREDHRFVQQNQLDTEDL